MVVLRGRQYHSNTAQGKKGKRERRITLTQYFESIARVWFTELGWGGGGGG